MQTEHRTEKKTVKTIIQFIIAIAAIGMITSMIGHLSPTAYNLSTSQDQMAAIKTEQFLNNLNLIASR
jgi:hypothetical protein